MTIDGKQITAGSVALAKLANIATARVLGRKTAGSGVPEELTAADVLAFLGTRELCGPVWAGAFTRFVAGSPELLVRNNHQVLAFDAAAVETAEYDFYAALAYQSGNNATLRSVWLGATATSGNVRVRYAVEYLPIGSQDYDSDSFATAFEVNAAADSVSGESFVADATASNSNLDTIVAGGRGRLQLSRVGNDATNDTMTGDAQLDFWILTQ